MLNSIFTHFLAAMIGGMIGVTAMAMCAVSGRADDDVSEKAREFANEIRELLGGDAE